ncbi:Region found in RelA / SpoT proteins [uncultured archaeon]|nr:Region found in RelA / SpoT proteins [uncultured archaeon]
MQKLGLPDSVRQRITASFHLNQKGLIETAYRSKGVDAQVFGTAYLEPGLRALKYLDKGSVDGYVTTRHGEVPIVTGSAPIVALALCLHGFDVREAKKVQISEEFKPYEKKALRLLEAYRNDFFPLATHVEQNCEYVRLQETGAYTYFLETAGLTKEFRNAVEDPEMRRLLVVMRAIDEWTKLGNLGKKRFVQTEERAEEEIAVSVLHFYGPLMERMRYNTAAQGMYDIAFGKLEPAVYSEIERIKHGNGYTARNFELASTMVTSIIEDLDKGWSLIGRVKSAYGYYRKVLRKEAEKLFAALPGAEKEKETEKFMKECTRMPIAEKIKLMNGHVPEAYDIFGYRLLLMPERASPADCKAIGEMFAEDSYYFRYAGHKRDYITEPKPNGYSSYHVTCRLSENGVDEILGRPAFHTGRFKRMTEDALKKEVAGVLPLPFEFQISTLEMDEQNNQSDASDHSKHKKNITAELRDMEKMAAAAHAREKPLMDSAEIYLEFFEEKKRGKLAKARTQCITPQSIKIFSAAFLPYKINKELAKAGGALAACSESDMRLIEQKLSQHRNAKIHVKLVKGKDSMSFSIRDAKEDFQVYPKKVD